MKGTPMRTILAALILLAGATLARAEPIHDAAQAGDLATVKKLLAESPFLRKALDPGGRTPATIAAGAGRIEVVEYLLSTGVSVKDANPDGRTMLHAACDGGKYEMVKLLVTKYRAPLGVADAQGWQPIHFACRKDPVDMLRLLIDQKADVNAQSKPGATPLIMATSMKMKAQVALLIERRADANKADSWNRTPLHVAAKNKDKAMVEMLLKAGGRVGGKDKDGKSALDEAVAAGATDIIPLLEKAIGPTLKTNRKK